jgi:Zn-dependent protease
MFSNAIKLVTLNGFDIKVDPSWLLIAALITWSLSQQYFPSVMPDQPPRLYFGMGVIAMLCFFASLVLHELAHSVVARRFGMPIKAITLFLFGGVAELDAEPPTAKAELLVAVAGPVMSLMLALGFWILTGVWNATGGGEAIGMVLSYLAMINLVLALFNLVPAFPLDGGRILRAYLWHRNGDILAATERAARSGVVFAYVLFGLGILSLFQGAQVAGLWQMLIGGFILLAARTSYERQLAKTAFQGKTVADVMTPDPVTVTPDMTLSDLVNRVLLRHRISFFPVIDEGVLLGHIDTDILKDTDRATWTTTRVGEVFAGLDDATTVSSDMPVQEVMERIAATRRRKFLVRDDNTLKGVVTLSDLVHLLSVSDMMHHRATGKPSR